MPLSLEITATEGLVNVAKRNGRPLLDRITKWLIDSGASFHIVAIGNIDGENGRIRRAKHPRRVETVGGCQVLDKEADVEIPLLGDTVVTYPLRTSTDILSLGLLCIVSGCRFVWEPFHKEPTLYDKNNVPILLYVQHDVPYIYHRERDRERERYRERYKEM